MCSDPRTNQDGNVFACKKCNECVGTAISGWVSRAMAEKATSEHTYVLALTYANDTQDRRDGAAVFRYSDIQKFFKNLRRQASYRLEREISVRYIVCGELGSLYGRVHWHVIVYADFDMLRFGNWLSFVTKKTVTKNEEMITTDPNKAKRLLWDFWSHGLMTVQIPDEDGMRYALKYAFKDQFGDQKSKGTMREAKSDHFAASFFRMSKSPPIGADWLLSTIAKLRDMNAVLPSLKLKVPGCRGYYVPSGWMLKTVIAGFRQTNMDIRDIHGKDAPQWSSLLSATFNSPSIWLGLMDGTQTQNAEDEENFAARLKVSSSEYGERSDNQNIRRRCGHIVPCTSCRDTLSDDDYASLVASVRAGAKKFGSVSAFEKNHRTTRTCNSCCILKNYPRHKRAFSRTAR